MLFLLLVEQMIIQKHEKRSFLYMYFCQRAWVHCSLGTARASACVHRHQSRYTTPLGNHPGKREFWTLTWEHRAILGFDVPTYPNFSQIFLAHWQVRAVRQNRSVTTLRILKVKWSSNTYSKYLDLTPVSLGCFADVDDWYISGTGGMGWLH